MGVAMMVLAVALCPWVLSKIKEWKKTGALFAPCQNPY
jgi:hypothetical protein